LERHSQILEELVRGQERHSQILEGQRIEFARLSGEVSKLKVTVGNIGARWGIMTEDMFRKAYEEILKSLFGLEYKVEKRKVKYDGKESEIDIVISDAREVIIEISASVNKEKARRIAEKINAYRKELGKEIPAYVITASVSADSVIFLRDEDIKVITPEPPEEEV
ncbi:MAG: DUF3782 domain-containing protein, partial [Candidatus Kryptonium sp.]